MPFLKIETSALLNDEKIKYVSNESSRIIARILRKPERYVMVALSPASMLMSATRDPTAFCDLRNVGDLSADVCAALSSELCTLLSAELHLAPARIYLNFTEIDAANWGWNGTTFG